MALELATVCGFLSSVIETTLTEHLCQRAQGLVPEILSAPKCFPLCCHTSVHRTTVIQHDK